MRPPARFALQVATGLALATALVWGLVAWLGEDDAGAGSGDGAAVEDDRVWVQVPPGLRGEAREVVVMAERARGEGGLAPLVEVLPSGHIVVRRPAPVASGPMSGPWERAGIVLPRNSLTALEPAQRAAFLALCAAFSGGKGLAPDALRGDGVDLGADLERLLRWQR